MSRSRIVIVGAGFGGVYTARHLIPAIKKGTVDVTLISRENYFLFTPLLHEVATGNLSPESVSVPLREIFHGSGVNIIIDTVQCIDTATHTVQTSDGSLPYDTLVIATGAISNDYGLPGVAEHALPLKTLQDATQIRRTIIERFDQTSAHTPQRALSFVVVGNGPTGVETTAELAEFVDAIEHRYFKGQPIERSTVAIVAADACVLKQFPVFLQNIALQELTRKGIHVRLNTQVKAVTADGIELGDGSYLASDLTIWTAGVKAEMPTFTAGEPCLIGRRVAVDEYLRVQDTTNIFALGDAAAHTADTQAPLPMLAQVAVAQAKILATNIVAQLEQRPLTAFRYHSQGALVSLGKWRAAGVISNVNIQGRFAWWLWRTIYLSKFFSWKKRFRIAWEWTQNLFAPRDITKI